MENEEIETILKSKKQKLFGNILCLNLLENTK